MEYHELKAKDKIKIGDEYMGAKHKFICNGPDNWTRVTKEDSRERVCDYNSLIFRRPIKAKSARTVRPKRPPNKLQAKIAAILKRHVNEFEDIKLGHSSILINELRQLSAM